MVKVGIISPVANVGKTTLSEVLAGVYSISQNRAAAIFSTGLMDDLVSSVTEQDALGVMKPDVVEAMLGAMKGERDLLDYGRRVGMENVYMYDLHIPTLSEEAQSDLICTALNGIPVDLSIIEISGDPTSEVNQKTIKECDCLLMLVPATHKAIMQYPAVIEQLPKCVASKNVCTVAYNIDANIIATKKLATMLKKGIADLYTFPRNDCLPKLALLGGLDSACEKIVHADPQYVNLRQPLYEIMSYLFDTDRYKIIRPIEKWFM